MSDIESDENIFLDLCVCVCVYFSPYFRVLLSQSIEKIKFE